MIELSQGEIADRITVLELKQQAGLPTPELEDLRAACRVPEQFMGELRIINKKAWVIIERLQTFFYDLGPYSSDAVLQDLKAAHFLNVERIGVKNRINEYFHQPIERKTWQAR